MQGVQTVQVKVWYVLRLKNQLDISSDLVLACGPLATRAAAVLAAQRLQDELPVAKLQYPVFFVCWGMQTVNEVDGIPGKQMKGK